MRKCKNIRMLNVMNAISTIASMNARKFGPFPLGPQDSQIYYDFNNSSIVNQGSAGSSCDLAVNGSSVSASATAKVGSGSLLIYGDATSYAYTTSVSGFSLGAAVSICFWVKSNGSMSNQTYPQTVFQMSGASGVNLSCQFNNAGMYVQINQSGTAPFTGFQTGTWLNTSPSTSNTGFQLFDGAWHHVAIVCDGSNNWTVYRDNVSYGTGSKTYTGVPSVSKIYMGHYGGTVTSKTLWIDDFRVYNYALNSTQIGVIYNNTL